MNAPTAMAGDRRKRRIAVIAGNGRIPVFVVEHLERLGDEPHVIAIEGEAEPELLVRDHDTIFPGHPGVLMGILDRIRPDAVVMIGGVKTRPDLRRLRPDWTTIKLAAKMLPKLRSGDDALLRSVIGLIEDAGYPVLGVHELIPDLLARLGHIAGPRIRKGDRESLTTAVEGARVLGSLDAGQACIAIGKRIVALEGVEGTDLMIDRVAFLRAEGRISKRGGVLVKLAKPGQEIRADLPTIGVSTVEKAAEAGLGMIAVHAERALVADFEETCRRAVELKVTVVGIDPDAREDIGNA